jgi:hypothetical protein
MQNQCDETKRFYPDTSYDFYVGRGRNDGERCIFAVLDIYPIRYESCHNKIRWIDGASITIDIEYEKSFHPSSNREKYDSIIITSNQFSDALTDFVEHKNNRNVSTKLVTLDDIYTDTYFTGHGRDKAEQIKYFIKNAYDQWGTDNVLLVGGADELPVRESHVNVVDWDDGAFVSDLYYADVYDEHNEFMSWDSNENNIFGEFGFRTNDEVDLFPDVTIGRWACVNTTEVAACAAKVISYENNNCYAQDWFSNIAGIGGDTHVGDSDNVDEGEYINDAICEAMTGFRPVRLYASTGELSGYLPTGVENIENMFNEGCGFVNFIGHGATWGYGTHPHNDSATWLPTPSGYFLTSDVLNLTNNKLPIVCTSGCDVGKFDEDDHCYSWALVANPNGGGIASCGASAVSYGGWGFDAAQELVGSMIVNMYTAFKQAAVQTFGEMWATALNSYIHADMTYLDYKVVESWAAFGDPTLRIAADSASPFRPQTPTGENDGRTRVDYTYTTKTSDPEGDQVFYRWSWGDGTYSDWVGPYNTGEVCEITHSWDSRGTYEICVAAKDVHGSISEWSDPLAVSMPLEQQTLLEAIMEWIAQLFGIPLPYYSGFQV